MKKFINFVLLISIMSCSAVAHSQNAEEVDPGFVILDVLFYRPVGFAVTIIGTGVFIGISPLTAFASIPKPHDAFAKVAKILILAPGGYTFIRPLGDRDIYYHVPAYKHKPVATQNYVEPYNNAVMPKQRPAVPSAPNIQPPQRYPDMGNGL